MIIFRYLVKEIVTTVLATTTVLLLIFMSTQFVHYLGDAAFGRFTAKVLLHIMILQIPYLMGLLLPLGFYLAILMAYGRLHADREMLVLSSCGMSQKQIMRMTFAMAAIVMIIVALLTCSLGPYVQRAQKQLEADAKQAPLVETVMPGRFYSLDGGKNVFYIAGVSRDRTQLQNIFAAQLDSKNPSNWSVIAASRGNQMFHKRHELNIFDVNRYTGSPGQKDFESQHFKKLTWFMNEAKANLGNKPEILSTSTLFNLAFTNPAYDAELQWRLSMPLSVLILTLLAVPLSHVNPRQGRFAQILPAVLIYIFYANMMFVGRSWIESSTIPSWLGLWWLHGILLMIAMTVLVWRSSFLQNLKFPWRGSR